MKQKCDLKSGVRVLQFGIWAMAVVMTPLATAADYLLADGPATGSLELDRTSYEQFGEPRRLGDRFGDLLTGQGPLERALVRRFPTLTELFEGTEISLQPRAYYRHQKRPGGVDREAFAVGGALGIQTGWWNDILQFGATGYTSQEIYGPSGRGDTGLLRPDQESLTVLGELWARAKWKDFTIQAGRTGVGLPYLNRNDSRMIPQTFELVSLVYKPHKGLTMGAGHTFRMKPRDSRHFMPMSEIAGAKRSRGVSSAGLVWTDGEHLDLAVFNHYGWDTFNTFYTELQWHGPGHWLPVEWRAAFQFTEERSVGDELLGDFETQNYGAKIALDYKALLITLAASKTADGNTILSPWGGSPMYVSSMIADFDRPGELAFRLLVSADLGTVVEGLSGVASVGTGDTDEGSNTSRQEELDLTVDYKAPWLDGVWLRLRGAWRDRGGALVEDYRVILNYEKSF